VAVGAAGAQAASRTKAVAIAVIVHHLTRIRISSFGKKTGRTIVWIRKSGAVWDYAIMRTYSGISSMRGKHALHRFEMTVGGRPLTESNDPFAGRL
jgi:hypothetical protein